jgi:mucin-19
VTFTGTNFVAGGTTVSVSGPGIVVSGVKVTDPTSLTAMVQLSGSPGARTVTVTTSGGTSGGQTFRISSNEVSAVPALNVTTGAGVTGASAGSADSPDGPTTAALFNQPHGMWSDGNNLYVADTANSTIRKIALARAVTTFAGTAGVPGSADGTGTGATFTSPSGIWGDGINLYVSDLGNHTIRQIVIATGEVTTLAGQAGVAGFADGAGSIATFNVPHDLWGDGTYLYVADFNNKTIRRVTIATGDVLTFAGQSGVAGTADAPSGPATVATFKSVNGIWGDGQNLYVADRFAHTIRKIVIATGVATTIAGSPDTSGSTDAPSGPGSTARFNLPSGIWGDGTNLFITDQGNQSIRKLVLSTGAVTTVAGSGASGTTDAYGSNASFSSPIGIWGDGVVLLVGDKLNNSIRQLAVLGGDATRPTVPLGLTASAVDSSQINLSWMASSDNVAVTGYRIERCSGQDCISFAQIAAPSGTSTTYSDTPLSSSTSYSYRVRATDAAGNLSGFSNTATAATAAPTPSAPTLSGISPSSGVQGASVTVTLTGTNFVADATTVSVSGTGVVVSAVNVVDATSLAAILQLSGNPGARTITVTTKDGTSGAQTFTITPEVTAPTAPSTLTATPVSSSQINLSWAASTDNVAVTGYTIERCSGQDCASFAQIAAASATSTTYSDTPLSSSTSYSYRVRATDAAANLSAYSNTATAATAAPIPNAPTLSAISPSSGVQGASVAVTLSGTGFVAGATTLAVSGTGVVVSSVNVVSATSLTATFVLSGATGSRNVTVTTGLGTSNTVAFATTASSLVGATQFQVTHFAGSAGGPGTSDGTGSAARFYQPSGMWSDGTNIYVADQYNNTIRKIVIATERVTTVAGVAGAYGSTDGFGSSALFGGPVDIWGDGTNLYVVESGNLVRKISISTGEVTTLQADATFTNLRSVWGDGANLYVVDDLTIRKIVIGSGAVTTIVTELTDPKNIWGDATNLYVADGYEIKQVARSNNAVSTLAGFAGAPGWVDGTGGNARFVGPNGVWGDGTNLYVTDGNSVRKIVIATAAVSTIAGDSLIPGTADATGPGARFYVPLDISGDATNLYVADSTNNTIRKIVIADKTVTTLAGLPALSGLFDGTADAAAFILARGIWGDGTSLYVADGAAIRKVAINGGVVTTPLQIDGITPTAIWGDTTNLYIADNNVIRKIAISGGAITPLTGNSDGPCSDGLGEQAQLYAPAGIWGDGANLYVTDPGCYRIRKIVLSTGDVTTLAGSGEYGTGDGTGTAAQFGQPLGIWGDGTNLYVTDGFGGKIRKIVIATGEVTTLVAGTDQQLILTDSLALTNVRQAQLFYSAGIWGDATNLYVTDLQAYTIRKIEIATGKVTTIAGLPGVLGSEDGIGASARFIFPWAIWGDGSSMFVSDLYSIRKVVPASLSSPTLSSISPASGLAGQTLSVTLSGQNFVPDGTNLSILTTTDITVSSITVTGPTTLMANFSVVSGASAGGYPAAVSTSAGTSGNVTFTVTGPTLLSINPPSAAQGASNVTATLTGTLLTGATGVTFSGAGVTGSITSATTTSIALSITITGTAATGARDVTVALPGGLTATLTGGFTVTSAAPITPALTGINPSTGTQGQVVAVTLDGTNFVPDATTVNLSGTRITASNINVKSPTSITADFTIAGDASTGARSVSVTTAGGTSNTATFTVAAASVITVTGQSQSAGAVAGGQRVIFTGTNFTSSQVGITFGGNAGIGAQRLSTTQIAVYTPPHTAGSADIVVSVGATSVTLKGAYTYTSGVSGTTFFQSTGLTTARGDRPAGAFLIDGRWIVTGGTGSQGVFTTTLSSTDVADATNRVFTKGPAMQTPRALHTATTLGDGRILIVGGASNGTSATKTTEILDSEGTAFTAGPAMTVARLGHTATLLADGRVLIAGGTSSVGGTALSSAEIFDPVSNTFGTPLTLFYSHLGHTANMLSDGRVFINGGTGNVGSEIIDPAIGSVFTTASATGRVDARAVTLPDGRVLITGGSHLNTALIFKPATATSAATFLTPENTMPAGVSSHSATLLNDGRVLVAGGEVSGGASTDLASIFDPSGSASAGTFGPSIQMVEGRKQAASTLLPTGGVIFAGGNGSSTLATAEIFGTPPSPILTSVIPAVRVVNTAAFTLDALGGNFAANSTIVFNGTRYQPVTFIDSQHISIQIPASAIATSACPETPCSFTVLVSNPDPLNTGSYLDSTALPFSVVAPSISLSPNPASVSTRGTVSVTVSVNQAPASPIAITVTSSDPNTATVSSPATIPANQTTTTVSLSGLAVGTVTLTGSLEGYTSGTLTASVTATPQPTLNVTPPSIVLNAAGTDTITVTRANSNNSVPLDVTLNVSREGYVNVPSVVTIPATQSNVVVPISGIAPDPTPPVIVTASEGSHISGSNTQISVQILQIQVTPALFVNPGSSANILLTLSSPAPSSVTSPCTQPGLCVNLVSAAPGTATVPTAVLIPQGQTQAVATVTGVAQGNTTVTATALGFPQIESQIQVQNVNLSFVPGSATFFAGSTYAQSVTLIMSLPALAGGQTVNLSSSDTSVATVPASVIIPSGSTTVNLTITGVSGGVATITASSQGLNSGTYSATVVAPTVRVDNKETAVSAQFDEGASTGVRRRHSVYISSPAPIGGIPVTITSSAPALLQVAPCNPSNPLSQSCTDTNPPQPAVTVSIPTGQDHLYFDIVGQDTAVDEVRLRDPIGVARDSAGNVYIADLQSHLIRRIDGSTGIISTFAGTGSNTQTGDGGSADRASVGSPAGLTIFNNQLYIAAYSHAMIRKIDLGTNIISTVVSGTIANPYQTAFNSAGDMFIAALNSNKVYRFASGVLTVYAGGGVQPALTVGVQATALSIGRPLGVAVDTSGNVYYSDFDNHIVNQIATNGTVARIAGTGTPANSPDVADAAVNGRLNNPSNLAYDSLSRALYVSDRNNQRIIRVMLNAEEPSSTPRPLFRVAGSPTGATGCCGDGLTARATTVSTPDGLSVDSSGNLLFGDRDNHRVRQLTYATGIIDTLAGGGVFGYSGDNLPAHGIHLIVTAPNFVTQRMPVDIDQSQWQIYSISFPSGMPCCGNTQITGTSFQVQVRPVNTSDRMAADTAVDLVSTAPTVMAVQSSPLTMLNNASSSLVTFTVQTPAPGNGQLQVRANGAAIKASALSSVITVLPVAIPPLTIDGNFSTADTGTGVRRSHTVNLPTAAGSGGVQVEVAVQGAGVQVSPPGGTPGATATITIPQNSSAASFDLIGGATAATDTRLSSPGGVAVDENGAIYVADYNNYRVRKLSGGVLSTMAGNGATTSALGSSALSSAMRPIGVTVDSANNVYAADANGHVIWQVTPSGGISIVAGTLNSAGSTEGIPGTGKLFTPYQVAIGNGSLYIADFNSNKVRKITAGSPGVVPTNGSMTTIAGGGNIAPANGVAATSATLGRVGGVAVDPVTDEVYFSDWDGYRVWKFAQKGETAGQLVLIAGTGTSGYNGDNADATQAQLSNPANLHFRNGALYIADQSNHRIRRVTTTGSPSLVTVAGTTSAGFSGDGDAAILAKLNQPFGVTTDRAGNLYFGDSANQRVREVVASEGSIGANSIIQTVIGNGTAGFAGDSPNAETPTGGRGTTITASIVSGPNYLPATVGVEVLQSQWQIYSISFPSGVPCCGNTQITGTSFQVQVRPVNTTDRMAADTAVDLVSTAPEVMAVQTSPLTMLNNASPALVTFTVQTPAPGNGQLQVQATGATFKASALSSAITVLPVAIPPLTIDGNFSTAVTGTGVRRNHTVNLPTVAGSGGVQVQVAVQGAGVQVSPPGGIPSATATITIPQNSTVASFDLIGAATAVTDTRLSSPAGVAVDENGAIYVADYGNYRVRKLSGGVLSTIAGNGATTSALGTSALSSAMRPIGVTVDSANNVYAADVNGHVIWQVTPNGGISIVAGTLNSAGSTEGVPGKGQLFTPYQVAIGNGSLYIADFNGNKVRKITAGIPGVVPTNGSMTTIAGGGNIAPANGVAATSANLGRVGGVAVDPVTGEVYLSDFDGDQVWKFAQTGDTAGQLVLIAGTGIGGYNGDNADATQAQLQNPQNLHFRNGALYIADQSNNRIRRVTTIGPPSLVTVAGTTSGGFSGDGDAAIVAKLNQPLGVTTDGAGNLYFGDFSNQRVREVVASEGSIGANSIIQTVIGNGTAGFAGDSPNAETPTGGRGTTITASIVSGPTYLPVTVGVEVQQSQWQINSISFPSGVPCCGETQITGTSFQVQIRPVNTGDRMAADTAVDLVSTAPAVMAVQTSPLTMLNNASPALVTFTVQTPAPGSGQLRVQATGAAFKASSLSSAITVLPVAIPPLTIDDSYATVKTATGARERHYVRLPASATGSPVQVNITSSDAARVGLALCDPSNSQNSTCTGATATAAGITVSVPVNSTLAYFDLIGLTTVTPDPRLSNPAGVAVDGNGAIYVADYGNYRVRKLSGGVLSTIAGNGSTTSVLGTSALSSAMHPIGVTVDSANNVYAADVNGHVIWQVTPSGGISIVAGTLNSSGSANGIPGTGKLFTPYQVAIGANGSLYIADFNSNKVRKITAGTPGVVPTNGSMTTIAGGGTTAPANGMAATSATLGRVGGVAVDPVTDEVYFSDFDGHRVWKFAQTGETAGQLVLIAGNGASGYNGDNSDATLAQLSNPQHLHFRNDALYIADQSNHRIRRVTTTGSPSLVTVAGTTTGGFSGDGDAAILAKLNQPFGVTTDGAGNLYFGDFSNNRVREVLALRGGIGSSSTIQTVIGDGTAGFAGDGLPGRGVTITASIASGGPTYLPVTVGVDVAQSTWEFVNFPANTTGPTFNFTVHQTSSSGTGMRMNGSTTFSVISNTANILSVPATLTIPNNGTVPVIAINSISRSGNVVTATVASTSGLIVGEFVTISGVADTSFNGTFQLTGTTATSFTYAQTVTGVAISAISRVSNVVTATVASTSTFFTGQVINISGVTDTSFNGTFTITARTSTTLTYAQSAANASSTGGSVVNASSTGGSAATGVATTIGSGTTQIIAQASETGIAIGASSNITVTPAFTSVTPSSSAIRGTAISVSIAGRNLLGATGITAPSGITSAIRSVTPDGQTMSAIITVGASVTAGAKTLTINTPTGNVDFTFTVN